MQHLSLHNKFSLQAVFIGVAIAFFGKAHRVNELASVYEWLRELLRCRNKLDSSAERKKIRAKDFPHKGHWDFEAVPTTIAEQKFKTQGKKKKSKNKKTKIFRVNEIFISIGNYIKLNSRARG